MRMADCHPDRPHKARGLCKRCWSAEMRQRQRGESAEPVRRASGRASVPAPTAEAPAGQMPAPPVAAPRTATKAARHANRYAGPVCPTDPDHGPLLAWVGTTGYFCPHSGHAIPARDRAGGPSETQRWFTQDEVEAAQAKALAS